MDKFIDIVIISFVVLLVTWLLWPNRSLTKKGDLTIWVTYNTGEYELFKNLCKDFEKKHKVKLNIQLVPWEGHQNKILNACNTRTTPDIARVDLALVPRLALGKALIPLDQYGVKKYANLLVKSAYESNVIYNPHTKTTHVYGLPDQTTCVALFYNKDHFKNAHLSIPGQLPRTWEQFVKVGKKLTFDKDKDGLIDQYAFAMRNTLWWTFPFLNSFGAKFIDERTGKCLLDSPDAIAAFQFKVDLYHKYKIEAGAWRPGAISPDTGFLDGKYSMILSGPWFINQCESSQINYGICPIPAGPAGSYSNIGGTDMVVFKTCRHPKLAYQFLEFMVSENFQKKWCEKLKQISVNKQVLQYLKTRFKGDLKVFLDQIVKTKPRPKIPRYSLLEEYVNQEMAAALQGQKTVKQALLDAKHRIEEEVLKVLKE
jgi:multiple sugar transport system substrate-binding protein